LRVCEMKARIKSRGHCVRPGDNSPVRKPGRGVHADSGVDLNQKSPAPTNIR
jgi:hypothetical protein